MTQPSDQILNQQKPRLPAKINVPSKSKMRLPGNPNELLSSAQTQNTPPGIQHPPLARAQAKTAVIGIDNGLKGAVTLLQNGLPMSIPMPVCKVDEKNRIDVGMLIALLAGFPKNSLVGIEYPLSQKGNGKTNASAIESTFISFGMTLAALLASGVPKENIFQIAPITWQSHFWAANKKVDTGAMSLQFARSMYPHAILKRTVKCTVDSDGISDSILIATYVDHIIRARVVGQAVSLSDLNKKHKKHKKQLCNETPGLHPR